MEAVSGQTSGQLRDEFLTLLVAQMSNQDPLQPVEQQDFLTQLAQFSTLESIENLGGRFDSLLQVQEMNYGSDLVGKTVFYQTDAGEASGEVRAAFAENNSVLLDVDGEFVEISRLIGITQ